jgi:F-type H+-transporting ATPase subunit a
MELHVNELFFWDPILLAGTPFEINRVVLLMFVASILCMAFFLIGARRVAAIPKGIGLMAEEGYMFVRNQIAIDVIGPEGIKFAPFLASLFFFIFFCNLLEIVPGINFPVTSRMAIPAFLALLSYVVFNIVGIRRQGLKYFVNTLFPPGVPLAIKPLLALIELFSVFFVRPLTLAIRLLANMMAGHVLLTIFFLFTDSFILGGGLVGLPLGVLTLLVACVLIVFELLVITLQAYIFTMLTAFYISESMHGHEEEGEHGQPQREVSEHEAQQETEGVREAA